MKEIPDKSVDMIIIDPPYSTPTITGFGRKQVKNVADLSIQETYMKCLKENFERVLKNNSPVFIFCDDKYYSSIYRAFYNWQSVQMLVWDKGKIGMGKPFRKRHELIVYANRETIDYNRTQNITHYPTVLNYKIVSEKEKVHPAQKPVDLLKDLIIGFTKENDIILDCFMGSGSTGVACVNTNRRFIGIELDEGYFNIAKKRIDEAIKDGENS
jgi:site-specific DNA-methyltransferase (adenine-specific)